MRPIAELVERVRAFVFRSREETELEEELTFHLSMETEQNVREGMSAEEARRQALLAFGGAEKTKEEVREARGTRAAEDLLRDLRLALRSLRRTPGFTVVVLLTLALGIGSVSAMFTIAYGVLLEPLPYGHPDRLVSVAMEASAPELERMLQPSGAYFTYKRFARRIADVSFYRTGNANIWTGAGVEDPERVTAAWITASTIPLLQVSPILGRAYFTDDEERARGSDAVIISESVWRSRFAGALDVIGRTLYANSVPRVIVGVMPEAFRFPAADTRVWFPAKLDRDSATVGDFGYASIARLKAGVTLARAQADLATALSRMAEPFPLMKSGTSTATWLAEARPTPVVVSLRDEITGGIAHTLWMLAVAAGLVLLVACANVGNLMLIRADSRQFELAVREALGAGRARIVTHVISESVILAAAAGAAGLSMAWAAVRALVAFGPPDVPRLAELSIDGMSVVFVILASLLSAIVCAVPAFRPRRTALSIDLRDGGRGETAGRASQRVRATTAALQIAVAFVIVAGSTLLLRTFERLHHERTGFDASNVITLWTQLPFARYDDSSAVSFYARLAAAVGELSGVRAVGLTSRLPLGDGEVRQQAFRLGGEERSVMLPTSVVGDDYFAALGIPLIAGRGFERLGVQRDGEVVVSQRAAETIWNDATGSTVLGKRLTLAPAGPTYTVIGVVGNVREHDLATAPSAMVYVPHAVPIGGAGEPGARRTLALVVKTAGSPAPLLADVRRIVRELDPTVPIFNVETMTDVVRASTARVSFTLALMSAAALITLLLATVGLYGVMAYVVGLRTREFGVCIALGADPRRVASAVAARGMTLIAAGILAGLASFILVAPFLRAFVYGVTPGDPVTLAAAALALVATGVLANWLPARRAARIDPAQALRAN